MDNNISFSKIVATPTLNSWSQAYNAGKLFAVLSLGKTIESPEIESLNMLGKDLLERLEKEFFIIEDKNLESIKKAVSVTFENDVKGIAISFAAGTLVNNVLYLFCLRNAKVFIKRNGSFGLVLGSENSTSKNVISSSGFLKQEDLIVLATEAFSQVITEDDLNFSLNDSEPSEIAESLAPKIHKAENGKASAIIIKYKKPLTEEVVDEGVVENELEEIKQEEAVMAKAASPLFKKYFDSLKARLKKPNFRLMLTKKIYLFIAIVIVVILSASILFAIREQNNVKTRALFAQIYPEAQKKYDEGQGLIDLNKSLARDSFLSAQKILQDNKDRFSEKSKEAIQTQDLLIKVDDGLAQVSPIDKSGLDRSKLSIAVQNGSGIEGTAGKAGSVLKEFGYNVASTENADNYNYQGVTIKVKKENSNFLDLLKRDLSKDYTVSASFSDLSPDSPADALIIIGK